MIAVVDQDSCIGCGVCVEACPEAFRFNADGKSEAYADGDDGKVSDAISECPVGAISEA